MGRVNERPGPPRLTRDAPEAVDPTAVNNHPLLEGSSGKRTFSDDFLIGLRAAVVAGMDCEQVSRLIIGSRRVSSEMSDGELVGRTVRLIPVMQEEERRRKKAEADQKRYRRIRDQMGKKKSGLGFLEGEAKCGH